MLSLERVAIDLSNSGKHRGAEVILKDLLSAHPTKSLRINYALVLERQGRISDALDAFSQAAAAFPNDSDITIPFAELAVRHPEAAVSECTRRRIEGLPIVKFLSLYGARRSHQARQYVSEVLSRSADWREVIRCFDHARMLDPWNLTELELGSFLSDAGPHDWNHVLKDFYDRRSPTPQTLRAIARLCPSLIATLHEVAWKNGATGLKDISIAGATYPYRISVLATLGDELFLKCVWSNEAGYLASVSSEHRFLKLLEGLNVPQYVDHLQRGDTYAVLMTRIEGEPLSSLTRADVTAVRSAARSLIESIHERGVLHGDISAANLLVAGQIVGLVDLGGATCYSPRMPSPDLEQLDVVLDLFHRAHALND